MKNREPLLLIIIMVVSASLVAFLYSPVVTKNDFGSDGFGLNPGVNYGGKVVNAIKRDNSFIIPDRSMPIFTANASNFETSLKATANNSFSETTNGSPYNVSYSVKSVKSANITQNNTVSGYSGMAQVGAGGIFNHNSNQIKDQTFTGQNIPSLLPAGLDLPGLTAANYRSSSNPLSNGFMALVSDVSSNLISKNNITNNSFTDEGQINLNPSIDFVPSLPIPDGTYFLLFLTAGYFLFKRRWVPKSKRISPPVPEEEYQMQYENTTLDKYMY
jgi:hypothetical protein